MGRRTAHRVSLPVFVKDEDIGLGDLIKGATRAVGIAPCCGCEERARKLNRWLTLARRHDKGG